MFDCVRSLPSKGGEKGRGHAVKAEKEEGVAWDNVLLLIYLLLKMS